MTELQQLLHPRLAAVEMQGEGTGQPYPPQLNLILTASGINSLSLHYMHAALE